MTAQGEVVEAEVTRPCPFCGGQMPEQLSRRWYLHAWSWMGLFYCSYECAMLAYESNAPYREAAP